MNIEKEFVPYEQACELKQLGFDEECLGYYTYRGELIRYAHFEGKLDDFQTLKNSSLGMSYNWCTAPTFSQAFRWFREKHGPFLLSDYGKFPHITIIQNLMFQNPNITHEEAEIACLNNLIEIVKNKQS
jgi:hypothetical protein